MAGKKKTWTEKYYTPQSHVVKKVDKDFADMKVGAKMLIATPAIIENYLKQIKKGSQADIMQIRKDLAAEYHTDVTCPVTTGIFLRIVAEKAYEDYQRGTPIKNIAPFWRVINEKSAAAKKLSFGVDFLKEQRQKEGLE